jgi:hypothetical protein
MDGQTPIPPCEIRGLITTSEWGKLQAISNRLLTMLVVSKSANMEVAAAALGIGLRNLSIRLRSYGYAPRQKPKGIRREDFDVLRRIIESGKFEQPALTAESEIG